MDRERHDSQDAAESRTTRPGPFGVREVTAPAHLHGQEASPWRSAGEAPEEAPPIGNSATGDSKESPLPGDTPVARGETPAARGETPAARGETPAADGESPATRDGSVDADIEGLRNRIVDAMKTVYDPEIPVNIYDLGMVYEIEVRTDRSALVTMTLTSPACPVAGTLPGEVEDKLNEVDGVQGGKVELVWDPPWTPERMSESARLELGMF